MGKITNPNPSQQLVCFPMPLQVKVQRPLHRSHHRTLLRASRRMLHASKQTCKLNFLRLINKITMRSFNAKVSEAKSLGPNKGVSLKIACSKSGCASLSSDSKIQDGGPTGDKKDFNWGCETAAT